MAGEQKLTIAVTGAAGYIGTRLVRLLDEDDRVDRILGFDTRRPRAASKKMIFDEIDIRSEAIAPRLAGVDVVVHLAFIMDPIKDETHMRDVNVNGSQNVFRAAGKAGVNKIVYTSSAVAYGAHPDNEVPLTEESALRANLDFSYPAQKLEVEYVLKEVKSEFPDLKMVVLRPTIVFGPHTDNAWSHVLESPFLLGVSGHRPPMQFIHEEDVAAAAFFATTELDEGYFNVAADGWLEIDQIVGMLGRRRIEVPDPIAFALMERMWRLGWSDAPAGMMHYLMHPWVVSNAKLTAAGFKPRHSNEDALAAVVDRTRDHVRIGGARLRRKDVSKIALAGAGVAGGAVAVRALRRRR
ncbi:MAG: NAD-dependent epimerase/dehydratase family protein [Actinomycetota bacterium]|nr:NAD-dependent epimerase/dehydratase family protein [Actinomycetota bacterium]